MNRLSLINILARVLLSTVLGGIWLGASSAQAEEGETSLQLRSEQSGELPRYRLAETKSTASSPQEKIDEIDFLWSSLTENGPASGADPIIGDSMHHSYYDFRDGNPLPFYIVKKR